MLRVNRGCWEAREKKGHHSPDFEARQKFRPPLTVRPYSSTAQAPSTAHNTRELFTEMEA